MSGVTLRGHGQLVVEVGEAGFRVQGLDVQHALSALLDLLPLCIGGISLFPNTFKIMEKSFSSTGRKSLVNRSLLRILIPFA